MANGQPRPAFYFAVFAVVIGLVGLAIWLMVPVRTMVI